jgi:ornithine cyclodeaminase/alanine dehydrogenase-like protein (mu-crystallin family)
MVTLTRSVSEGGLAECIMPVLFLTEDEVRQILTMEMAIEGVEAGLRKMALEETVNNPRARSQTDHAMLHVLSAAAKTLGVLGLKAYTTTKKGTRFHVTLYDGKTGEMSALMQADFMGQMRTGAASAVATKHLAKKDATACGIFGSGRQARTQLLGVSKVRKLTKAHVWSPTETNRNTFATEMSAACGIEVVPVATPEQAARNLDIVCTATSAREPILKGEWLSPGQHLNIAGSNFLAKSEIDLDVVKRCNLITIDSKDQGKLEAGDFMDAFDKHVLEWADITEIGRIVANRAPGRESPEAITMFKSLGIGLEDIAVGIKVLTKAKEAGIGKWLEL